MRDNDDFFEKASEMQSQMIKSSWKTILSIGAVYVTGLLILLAGAAVIIKMIFF